MPVLPRSFHKILTAGALLAAAGRLDAQMPGMPTLQNAWANPGITAAVNGGMGGGSRAFGAAAAWAPRSGRFQLSAGAGLRQSEDFGNGPAFGARLALPVFSFAGGALGVAGFVGVGAAREPDRRTADADGAVVAQVPIGAAIGYRRAFSFIRGASIYAAPFYALNRITVGDSSWNKSAFRFSVGTDVGITNRIGVTAGAEFGGAAGDGEPGPVGAVYGLGVSMAFGRR